MNAPPQLAGLIQAFSVWIIPLVLAITLHEAAHGFAALRFGDDTAQRMGRISANPLHHVDPFGTLVLPALLLLSGSPFMFGWAKPVPVNFGRLKPQRAGMVVVALAGPLTNIVLAVLSALLLHLTVALPDVAQDFARQNLIRSVQINLVLAVFNMIPLPPLDGGRVAVALLPRAWGMKLAGIERYTFMVLLGAMIILPMMHINLFAWVVGIPVEILTHVVATVTGLT
jgi:Zn-dependent protease